MTEKPNRPEHETRESVSRKKSRQTDQAFSYGAAITLFFTGVGLSAYGFATDFTTAILGAIVALVGISISIESTLREILEELRKN